MAFCGFLHHTANQRTATNLLYYFSIIIIIIIGYVLTYFNYSSLKIKFFNRS